MTKERGENAGYRDETLLSVLGRDPAANHGVVNPPVYHASTILHENAAALKEATFGPREYGRTYYGRYGTPTTFPLQDSIAALERGYRTYLFGSGKAAIVASLLAFVKSGDHVLMTDSAYGPTAEPGARPAQAHGGRDHLLRPLYRRWHRRTDAPGDQRGGRRIAGLAHLRGPGLSGRLPARPTPAARC